MSERLPSAFAPYEVFKRSRRRKRNQEPAEPLKVVDKREKKASLEESRIRVSRGISIKNHAQFTAISEALALPDERGQLKRKNIGGFALTVFDTGQQPLIGCTDYSADELEELFTEGYPTLAKPTKQVSVTGLGAFGKVSSAKSDVFVALRFAPQDRIVFEEPKKIQDVLSESGCKPGNKLYVPHVSVAKVFGKSRSPGELDVLADPRFIPVFNDVRAVMPASVQFEPAVVEIYDRDKE